MNDVAHVTCSSVASIAPRDFSNISEAMAMLEAEAEAIMDIVGRRERQEAEARLQQQGLISQDDRDEDTEEDRAGTNTAGQETPMDVEQPGLCGFWVGAL